MRKMDEMERNIQMRSAQYGYLFLVASLACLMVYNTLHGKQDILVLLLLFGGFLVQNISNMYMQHKMVRGDEEYKETSMAHKILTCLSLAFSIVVVVLLIGAWILSGI